MKHIDVIQDTIHYTDLMACVLESAVGLALAVFADSWATQFNIF